VLALDHLLFPVLVEKELVVLRLGVLLKLLVLFGDRPVLPVFMGRELQLVVLVLTLLPLLSLLPLWEVRLPGLARALLLGLVPVLVGIDMRLVVALLQVLVGDWLMLPELVGTGLTLVAVLLVLQRLALVVKELLLVDKDLRLLVLALVLLLLCGTL
jgi:hypothetical protein